MDAFLLYHDPDNEIMAFVFPEESEVARDVLAEKAAADFEATQATLPDGERLAYAPATFKGLNELVAFVERDEEIGLQGEVLEAIARESDLMVLRVRPSEARERDLPRLLPVLPGDLRRREAVMAGLRRLRDINDRLTVYTDALQRLEKNPAVLDELP